VSSRSRTRTRAYVWFKFKAPYLGLEWSLVPSFFLEALGVKATSCYWSFRGADPADYYGAEYGVYDFTRMHLYRDASVYKEVGHRAQAVRSGGRIAPYLSIADWNASRYSPYRRLGAAAGQRRTRGCCARSMRAWKTAT